MRDQQEIQNGRERKLMEGKGEEEEERGRGRRRVEERDRGTFFV